MQNTKCIHTTDSQSKGKKQSAIDQSHQLVTSNRHTLKISQLINNLGGLIKVTALLSEDKRTIVIAHIMQTVLSGDKMILETGPDLWNKLDNMHIDI